MTSTSLPDGITIVGKQALENMTGLADLIIEDYGYTAKGLESTVVGVMNEELRIFRQGAIYIDL